MFSNHYDAVKHANDATSLLAWKAFSLAFWEEDSATLPAELKKRLFEQGFYSSRAALYEFNEQEVSGYLSDYQSHTLHAANHTYQTVLLNRVLCGHVMANYFEVAPPYCIVTKQGAQWLEPAWWHDQSVSPAAVLVQPLSADSVAHYQKVVFSGTTDTTASQKALVASLTEEANAYDASLVVSAAPEQHAWLTALCPGHYHLLHVLMVRSPESGLPDIAAASLVVGRHAQMTKRALPCVEEGALSVSIDPTTGLMTACRGLSEKGELATYAVHPDSSQPMVGERLPHWEQVKSALLRFFDESSYLHVCNVSVVITETGASFFGTHHHVIAAHQMHQPLLEHPSIAHHLNAISG